MTARYDFNDFRFLCTFEGHSLTLIYDYLSVYVSVRPSIYLSLSFFFSTCVCFH